MGKKILVLVFLILVTPFTFYAKEEKYKAVKKEVLLEGNKSFSLNTLFESCGFKIKKWGIKNKKITISEEECIEFSENLSVFYKREGFFDVLAAKSENEKSFFININEGKEYLTISIDIQTAKNDEQSKKIVADALSQISINEGKRFRVEDYETAKKVLEKSFGNNGFPFVKVTEKAEVNVKDKNVKVSYLIEEGEKANFGETIFEGIIHTEEKILRKLLKYKEGEIFQISKVEETNEKLYATGLFDVVTIKVKKADEKNCVPIKIIVKEGRHRKVKVSLGYGADEKFRFQAGFETLRIFDRCVTAGFNFKKSSLENSYEFHILKNYAFADYSLYVRAKKQTLYWIQSKFETTLITTGVEKKFGIFLSSLEINYENIEKIRFSYPYPPIRNNALTPETFSFRFNLILNRSDNLIDPSKGYFAKGYVEGNDVSNGTRFSKVCGEFRKYFTLKNSSVLAFKFKMASILTKDSINEIPYPYRFFTGGQLELRGYRFSSLSPLSENGSLEGGKGVLESSLECRFPIREDFKGLVFFETGKATRKSNPLIKGEPFKSDIGFGLRYMTVVGPVGMDVAFRLNDSKYSSSLVQIYLFIGYSF